MSERPEAVKNAPMTVRQVTEITLERTECLGRCPVYHVALRRDGSCIWTGHAWTERLGVHAAAVISEDFDRLASTVEALGFFDLEARYSDSITCQPSTTTTVRAGSAVKSVYRYGQRTAPRVLIEAEDAIDSFCEELEWRAVPEDERVTLLARHRRR
jgi:hypothetical protein